MADAPAAVTPPAAPAAPAVAPATAPIVGSVQITNPPPAAGDATPATPPVAKADPPAAPAVVEYKFSKPEGLADSDVARVTETAKSLGLSQEAAQKLLDGEAALAKADIAAMEREKAQQNADWIAALKSDPVYGGAKHAEATTAAAAFLTSSPEGIALAAEMKANGLDNYPPLIRFLARHGLANREGKMIEGAPAAGEQSFAQLLYPKQ